MKSILLVCFCLLLTAECETKTKYDFLKLAEQWPGSLHLSSDRNFRGVCSPDYPIRDKNKFFIHGLWPANNTDPQPEFCPPRIPFDYPKLDGIMDKLKKDWPSYVCAERSSTFSDNIKFWEYEWLKHGTCSNRNQYGYFARTVQLHLDYDPFKCLKNEGIVPSDSEKRPLSDIENAFKKCKKYNKNYNGQTPLIKCLKDPKTGSSYLWELEICLEESSFKMIACPGSSNYKCDSEVFLPPFK